MCWRDKRRIDIIVTIIVNPILRLGAMRPCFCIEKSIYIFLTCYQHLGTRGPPDALHDGSISVARRIRGFIAIYFIGSSMGSSSAPLFIRHELNSHLLFLDHAYIGVLGRTRSAIEYFGNSLFCLSLCLFNLSSPSQPLNSLLTIFPCTVARQFRCWLRRTQHKDFLANITSHQWLLFCLVKINAKLYVVARCEQ